MSAEDTETSCFTEFNRVPRINGDLFFLQKVTTGDRKHQIKTSGAGLGGFGVGVSERNTDKVMQEGGGGGGGVRGWVDLGWELVKEIQIR